MLSICRDELHACLRGFTPSRDADLILAFFFSFFLWPGLTLTLALTRKETDQTLLANDIAEGLTTTRLAVAYGTFGF